MTKTNFESKPTDYLTLDDTFWRRLKAIPRIFFPEYRTKEELREQIQQTRAALQSSHFSEQEIQRNLLQSYIQHEFNETDYAMNIDERISKLSLMAYPDISIPANQTKASEKAKKKEQDQWIERTTAWKNQALALSSPVQKLVEYMKKNNAELICASLENYLLNDKYETKIQYEIIMIQDPYFTNTILDSHELKKQGFTAPVSKVYAKQNVTIRVVDHIIPEEIKRPSYIKNQEIVASQVFLAGHQVRLCLIDSIENFSQLGLVRYAPFIDLTDIYRGDKK